MRHALGILFLVSSLCLAPSVLAKDLRVGIAPDAPPFAYLENGKLTGIEVAAAESLGKLLNRDVEFIETAFPELIPALESGKIDIIMSGMSITDDRSQRVSFTKSYMDAGQMAIIRFEDAGRLGFKGSIFRPGSKVAVEKGTTGEAFSSQHLRKAEVTVYATLAESLDKLRQREVDFLIHDAPVSWSLANNRDTQDLMSLNHAMTEEHLAWAVSKNNPELLTAVNKNLDELQSRGIIRAIIKQWIPVTVEVEEAK